MLNRCTISSKWQNAGFVSWMLQVRILHGAPFDITTINVDYL